MIEVGRGGRPGLPPAASAGVAVVREELVPGAVPRYEIPGWRERFGVVAGITGRGVPAAGVDVGADAGFDLGLWSEQPVGQVMSRWRAFRRAEPGFGGWALGTQVHGAEVLWHDDVRGWLQIDGVDGHATRQVGTLLTVTVADCIPVYLVAPRQRGAALLHSGWRGTAAGILAHGVERLRERLGCAPADIVMHCGVGICGACYEVGAEVVAGCGLAADGDGPWHVDLRDHLLARADALGLGDATVSAWCSAHDAGRFYSHRASRGRDGRMVAYLGFPATG
jgi:polyphenol oxidase